VNQKVHRHELPNLLKFINENPELYRTQAIEEIRQEKLQMEAIGIQEEESARCFLKTLKEIREDINNADISDSG